jgi:nitrite reductase/ring-hydroxylating ferredoxin subunit
LATSRYFEVAKVAQLRPGRAITVNTRHGPVAIFNVHGNLFALEGHCIRCATRIATGRFDEHEVSCRRCGWRYALRTGAVVQVPRLRLETYTVKVVGSSIMLGTTFAPRQGGE